MQVCPSPELARSAGSLQVPAGFEPGVDVGNVARFVAPGGPDDARLVDEERRPSGHVVEAAELEADTEGPHGVAVEVREEPEVQVERLRPGDVRVGRVAGDPDGLDAGCVEVRSPVTQELHLVRSGG